MLCKNCGVEIPEGTNTCELCGEAVNEITEQPKAKKRGIKGLIIAAAVVVAAVALVLFNLSAVTGFAIKTFGSNEDYLRHVEGKALGSLADIVTEYYGAAKEGTSGGNAASGEIKLNVGDDIVDFTEDYFKENGAGEVDMSFLQKLSFDISSVTGGGKAQAVLSLKIGEEKILDADYIIDEKNLNAYIALKNISDTYLKLPMQYEAEEAAGVMGYYTDEEFLALLPTEKELNKMLDRYIGVMLENIDGVKENTDTLKIGENEQKVTALEVALSEKEAMAIAKALLEEVREDAELEKYIESISAYLEQQGEIDDADEVYDEFIGDVDAAIKDIENGEFDEEENLFITAFVNSRHQIIGHRVSDENGEIFSSVMLIKGKSFSAEIIADELRITGSGKYEKSGINAEFEAYMGDNFICTITAENIKTEKDTSCGKMTVALSDRALEELGLDTSDAASIKLENPKLEIAFNYSKDKNSVAMNVINNEKVLLGFER